LFVTTRDIIDAALVKFGTKTFADGSYYSGEFYRDSYDGKGLFLYRSGNGHTTRIESGTWRRGEMMTGVVTTYGEHGQIEKRVQFVRIL
jgi:hypothetical protein